jgi:hypothetical protein
MELFCMAADNIITQRLTTPLSAEHEYEGGGLRGGRIYGKYRAVFL